MVSLFSRDRGPARPLSKRGETTVLIALVAPRKLHLCLMLLRVRRLSVKSLAPFLEVSL